MLLRVHMQAVLAQLLRARWLARSLHAARATRTAPRRLREGVRRAPGSTCDNEGLVLSEQVLRLALAATPQVTSPGAQARGAGG